MSLERGIYVPREEETKDLITPKGMKEIEMEKEREMVRGLAALVPKVFQI